MFQNVSVQRCFRKLYRIITTRKRSLRRLCFYTCVILFTGGACVAGVVHGRGRGACVAGGHAWQGSVHGRGGMHGRECVWSGGHVWQGGICGGGCAWQGACMAGGMLDRGACMPHMLPPPPDTTRYGRSMRGRYASYWNSFLFYIRTIIAVSDICGFS